MPTIKFDNEKDWKIEKLMMKKKCFGRGDMQIFFCKKKTHFLVDSNLKIESGKNGKRNRFI